MRHPNINRQDTRGRRHGWHGTDIQDTRGRRRGWHGTGPEHQSIIWHDAGTSNGRTNWIIGRHEHGNGRGRMGAGAPTLARIPW
jgi:hypothetical protein